MYPIYSRKYIFKLFNLCIREIYMFLHYIDTILFIKKYTQFNNSLSFISFCCLLYKLMCHDFGRKKSCITLINKSLQVPQTCFSVSVFMAFPTVTIIGSCRDAGIVPNGNRVLYSLPSHSPIIVPHLSQLIIWKVFSSVMICSCVSVLAIVRFYCLLYKLMRHELVSTRYAKVE